MDVIAAVAALLSGRRMRRRVWPAGASIRPHDLSAPLPCYVPRRSPRVAEASANLSALLSRLGLGDIARRVYAWGWRQEGWVEPLSAVPFPSKRLVLWKQLERMPASALVETWGPLP